MKKFIVFDQNYYLSPMINKEIGMNKRVYVEVKNECYDLNAEEATCVLEKLGFDMDDSTVTAPWSSDESQVWSHWDEVCMDDKKISLLKESSVIMLDGSIINL
jgi:hypothetical protein